MSTLARPLEMSKSLAISRQGDRDHRGVQRHEGRGEGDPCDGGGRNDALAVGGHSRIVTWPVVPSTRTRLADARRLVPSLVPTTAGMPISRETMAACDAKLP